MWKPTVDLNHNRRQILLKAAKDEGADVNRLEALRKNLLQMSPEELRTKVQQIRADRKLRKEPKKARKERVRANESAKSGIERLLAGMSEADRVAFLEELESGS